MDLGNRRGFGTVENYQIGTIVNGRIGFQDLAMGLCFFEVHAKMRMMSCAKSVFGIVVIGEEIVERLRRQKRPQEYQQQKTGQICMEDLQQIKIKLFEGDLQAGI
jgi:hypothetical protein